MKPTTSWVYSYTLCPCATTSFYQILTPHSISPSAPQIEHKRAVAGAEAEAAACLQLPSRRDSLPAGCERGLARGALLLQPRDCLAVATRLCSTKLTQRGEHATPDDTYACI